MKRGRAEERERWRKEERRRFVFDLGPLKKILAALATSRLSKLQPFRQHQPQCGGVNVDGSATGNDDRRVPLVGESSLYCTMPYYYLYGTLLTIIEAQGSITHLTSPLFTIIHNTSIASKLPFYSFPTLLHELYERAPHVGLMRQSPFNSPPLRPLP